MPPPSRLLGDDTDHVVVECHPDTILIKLRLQMGDRWLPCSVGFGDPAPTHIHPFRKSEYYHYADRYILRKAQLATPLDRKDDIFDCDRTLVILLHRMVHR